MSQPHPEDPDKPDSEQEPAAPKKRRWFLPFGAALFSNLLLAVTFVVVPLLFLIFHPASPLPSHLRPNAQLKIDAPVTILTRLQLRRALRDGDLCRAILTEHETVFTPLEPLERDANCHIRERVRLTETSGISLEPLEMSCAMALRMAMWVEHGITEQVPDVTRLHHIGSYNCRRMRTGRGQQEAWSQHATADAVDITGVTLADGRRLSLINDWESPELQSLHESACDWFPLVLGPDYNALHADHFHLQVRGWGFCR